MKYIYVVYGEILRGDWHDIYNFGIYSDRATAEERLDQIEKSDPLHTAYYWFEKIQLNQNYEQHEVTYL